MFFNQSYHMMEAYLEGPDTVKLLTRLGVNSMASFTPNKAKRYMSPATRTATSSATGCCFISKRTASASSAAPGEQLDRVYRAATGE